MGIESNTRLLAQAAGSVLRGPDGTNITMPVSTVALQNRVAAASSILGGVLDAIPETARTLQLNGIGLHLDVMA